MYFYYLYGDPKEKFKKQEIKKNRKRKNNRKRKKTRKKKIKRKKPSASGSGHKPLALGRLVLAVILKNRLYKNFPYTSGSLKKSLVQEMPITSSSQNLFV